MAFEAVLVCIMQSSLNNQNIK